MEHQGSKTLYTNRLILRKLTLKDAKMMFNNWASDPDVTKYLTWPTHESIEVTKTILSIWKENYKNDNYYQWGIVLKDSNELIGAISIVNIIEHIQEVEVGYCLSKKYWNQGITSEAFKEVIRFMFEEVKVNRVAACHAVNNPISGKVMLKCNLKYEGTLRQKALTSTKELCDVAYYSILKSEYEK